MIRNDLHKYQEELVDFILDKKRCALFVGMGLGKTVSTLTAIQDLQDSMAIDKTLIIAPLRVCNTVWHKEIENWEHLHRLTYSICTGTEQKRIEELDKKSDIYIINRENVEWLVNKYGKHWHFDFVVIDESSSFKSPSSKRFKALRKVSDKSEYFTLLTGTPSPNGLLDLWSQIYLLDRGIRLGRAMGSYKQRYFKSDYWGYVFTPYSDSQEKIESKLKDICKVLNSDDHLDIPPKIESSVQVVLTERLLKQYKELEKDFILTIKKEEISAKNAAVVGNKLLQFCNGAIYNDEGEPINVHKLKLDALEEIVDDNGGDNLLVAYNYRSDLERLQKRFPNATIMDKQGKVIDDWNNGRIKMLLAHPASAGHGLNLQKGGSLVVWFGLNWSLELYQQFNARLHRQKQTKVVRIVHIICQGCMDEKVLAAIKTKANSQYELLLALKQKYTKE